MPNNTLESGNYLIINAKERNLACLASSKDHALVTGGTYSSTKKGVRFQDAARRTNLAHESLQGLTKNLIWSLTRYENGRYEILNNEFGSLAFGGVSSTEGDSVKGHKRIQQWEIKPTRKLEHYLYAPHDLCSAQSHSDCLAS